MRDVWIPLQTNHNISHFQSFCQPAECDVCVSEHYVICNDTLECLLVRQAGTEETVSIASRVALPYSWRTQRQPQVSHVTLI